MKPGIKTTELAVGGLSGGSVVALAQGISAETTLGAGIALGCAMLALGAIGVTYIMFRTKAKNGGAK